MTRSEDETTHDEKHQEPIEKTNKEQEAEEKDWRIYWNDGLRFKTIDNNFEMKIGGRFMWDGAIIDPDHKTRESFPSLSGSRGQVRRIRIYTEGTVYQDYEYKAQFDFYELPDILYKDVYIGMKNIPYAGTIRLGHQFEPFSLEELTSTKYITFMERALPTLAFYPSRNTGLILFNTALNKRLWWGAGASIPVTDKKAFNFSGNPGWNLSGRITGLPWFEDKTKLLHIGLGYIHAFRSNNTNDDARLEAKPSSPESNLANPLIDTGSIISDGADLISPEFALVAGPFSLQGEYFYSGMNRDADTDVNFSGFYAYASYFITGESRNYVTAKAAFDTVAPKKNFDLKSGSGPGAWEVALRYSYLNLNDEDIQGGRENNITAGLNWYINPNIRFMFNYVLAHVEDSDIGTQYLEDGKTNIFQMRFQIAF